MILLDAFALVAYLLDEPAAPEVEGLLKQFDTGVLVVNLQEAYDVLIRRRRVPLADVDAVLGPLVCDVIALIDTAVEDARQASLLRQRHYRKNTSELSPQDCTLLAVAQRLAVAIATADRALATAARAEGIALNGLPDTAGGRP